MERLVALNDVSWNRQWKRPTLEGVYNAEGTEERVMFIGRSVLARSLACLLAIWMVMGV